VGTGAAITIANCIFDGCNGLAVETVDGAGIEDVTISNITMRDLMGPPIFLRLGVCHGSRAEAVDGCEEDQVSGSGAEA
jgi:polygalacturonase